MNLILARRLCLFTRHLWLLFFAVPLGAQFNADDPFAGSQRLAASDEILIAVGENSTGLLHLRLFDPVPVGSSDFHLELLGSLTLEGLKVAPSQGVLRDSGAVDLAMLDLNGDGYDQMLVFFEGEDREPILQRPVYDSATGEFSPGERWYLTDLGFPKLYEKESVRNFTELRLQPAQLGTDRNSEFLIAYWAEGGDVQLIAAEFNEADELVVLGAIADVNMTIEPSLASSASDSARFDIAVGSLDGVYGDEIILAHVKQNYNPEPGETYRRVAARVYSFDKGAAQPFQFRAEAEEPAWDQTSSSFNQVFRLSVEAGDFNGDGIDSIVMASLIGLRNAGNQMRYTINFYTPDAGLTGFSREFEFPPIIESASGNTIWQLDLAVADINYDDIDDIAVLTRRLARLYTRVNESGEFLPGLRNLPTHNSFSTGEIPYVPMASGIIATDFDGDSDREFYGELMGFSLEGSGPSDDRTWRVGVGDYHEHFPKARNAPVPSLAITSGDINKGSLRMGRPTLYRRTEMGQPVMILNAPPTHFDVINGVPYDLNGCLTGDCGSYASYTLQTELIQEVSTEVGADWAISAGLSREDEGGLDTPIWRARTRVKRSLDGRYGAGFSQVRNSSTTIRETREFIARGDDLIYASVADVDILEYPVFRGDEFLGNVVSVVPRSPRMVVFNSKSPRAADYMTPHEPGNLLSYRSRNQFNNNPWVRSAVSSFSGFSWEMQSSGSSQWTLELSEFEQSSLSRSSEWSISARAEIESSASIGLEITEFVTGSMGVTVAGYLQGDYEGSKLSTHSTTVSVDHTILVNFGTVDTGILGDTTYEVTPYLYWSENGALVLDYAVDPVLGDGFVGWWQEKYGDKPDLAFTLPWRNDDARGLAISADQQQRTRNITVSPARPRAGDTVDLLARIHNYSLAPQNSPAAIVRFYLDNRDGRPLQLLQNSQGNSELLMGGIGPRESVTIALTGWRVPWHIDPSARIYVTIDEDNLIDEIHKDNNTGWALLGATGSSVWPDASVFGDGTIQSPWFGLLNQSAFPEIVHESMGQLHVPDGASEESLHVLDRNLRKWLWTRRDTWPYVFVHDSSQQSGRWLLHITETVAPDRWFYDFNAGSFVHESSL
ncbi:MAG: hypothetical protein JJU00_03905 [Opitutales bacterium]|nr:hypothetical protein [Opitutales bacterium]